jgi:cytochrome c-type biogenesis protein
MTGIGVPALFAAGLLTFLSPCVLPLLPIYLAMLAGASVTALREGGHGKRLVLAAAAFSLGIAVVFVGLGTAASLLGRTLSGHRTLVAQLAGLAVFLAGLKLMGFLRVPWLDREARPWLHSLARGGGLLWPLLFGAAFALGWSPCVGPILGSVLLYAAGEKNPLLAAGYLGIYALGLTLPLLALSLFAPLGLRLLDRAKRHLRTFEVASGVLLATMGLLFITGNEALLLRPLDSPAVADRAAPAPAAPITCGVGIAPSPAAPSPAAQVPAMLEFVADGCPICQHMAPVVAAAERDCSRHGVHVKQIDVATAEGRRLAAEHGVLGVPTFLFIDRDGREVARLVGQQPRDILIQSLEVLAGQRCDGFRPLPEAGPPGA